MKRLSRRAGCTGPASAMIIPSTVNHAHRRRAKASHCATAVILVILVRTRETVGGVAVTLDRGHRLRRRLLSEEGSGHWTKLHVHWRRRIDERAELELAAGRIYPEHGNVVGILVSRIKKAS